MPPDAPSPESPEETTSSSIDALHQSAPEMTEPAPSRAVSGVMIGPYHLLQMIGEGGMGEVWLAEQKHPLRRPVALKLWKTGMAAGERVASVQAKRQAPS